MTVGTLGAVSGRQAKVFIYEKVVPPAWVTLHVCAEVRRLTHTSCLPLRQVSDSHVNGWLDF